MLILTTCAPSHAMDQQDLNARTVIPLDSVTAALASAIPAQTQQTQPVGLSEYRQQEATTSSAPTHYCPRFAESYRHQAGLLCMPDHIMETICSSLTLKDIAALRLSCKQLCSAWDHERELAFTVKQIAYMCNPSNLAQGLEQLSQRLQSCRNSVNLSFMNEKLESLPREICLLTNLRKLNLGFNRLSQTVLPCISRWLSQLQELNLSDNALKQLPEEIQLLTHLRILNLSINSLSQPALTNICRWLPQLQELDLSFNNLEQLPEEIRLLTNLRMLNLQDNRLSQTAIANISKWLASAAGARFELQQS